MARESFLRYEDIVMEGEKEREMVKIIREFFAEAARGNVYTHMVRLVQLRAYGNHEGGRHWLQTLTSFKRALSITVHPDRFTAFRERVSSMPCSCTMVSALSI